MTMTLAVREALEKEGHGGFFALNEIAHKESAEERLITSKVPLADAMMATKGMTKFDTEELLSKSGYSGSEAFGSLPHDDRVTLYRAVRAHSRINLLDAEERANGPRLAQGHDAGWSGYQPGRRPAWAWVHDAVERGDLDEQIKKIHVGLKMQGIDPDEQIEKGIGPLGITDYASATSYTMPAFTIVRDITCTTVAQFNTAMAGLQAGDYIRVRGVTFTGEFTLSGKNPSGFVRIAFDDDPLNICNFNGFTSGSITTNPSIWITNCSKMYITGGNIHNPNGDYGIETYTINNIWWWNAIANNCGGSAFAWFPVSTQGAITNIDFKNEAHDNMGNYLIVDPHADKGGGVHTQMVGDASAPLLNSRFACYGHDEVAGDWMQIGGSHSADNVTGITIAGKAENYDFRISQNPTGWGILTWGPAPVAWHCNYFEATNMSSRAVGMNSLTNAGGMANCYLDYGVATNCCIYSSDLAAHDSAEGSSTNPWPVYKGGPHYGTLITNGSGGGGGTAPPTNTVAPQIVGQPVIGSTLSVALGTWTNTPTGYSYQWQRDNHGDGNFVNIGGSTEATMIPSSVASDGSQIRVLVAASNASGSSPPVASDAVAIVAAMPVNTAPPQISGSPSIGQTLTVIPGVWTNMAGYNPSRTYQWRRPRPA